MPYFPPCVYSPGKRIRAAPSLSVVRTSGCAQQSDCATPWCQPLSWGAHSTHTLQSKGSTWAGPGSSTLRGHFHAEVSKAGGWAGMQQPSAVCQGKLQPGPSWAELQPPGQIPQTKPRHPSCHSRALMLLLMLCSEASQTPINSIKQVLSHSVSHWFFKLILSFLFHVKGTQIWLQIRLPRVKASEPCVQYQEYSCLIPFYLHLSLSSCHWPNLFTLNLLSSWISFLPHQVRWI